MTKRACLIEPSNLASFLEGLLYANQIFVFIVSNSFVVNTHMHELVHGKSTTSSIRTYVKKIWLIVHSLWMLFFWVSSTANSFVTFPFLEKFDWETNTTAWTPDFSDCSTFMLSGVATQTESRCSSFIFLGSILAMLVEFLVSNPMSISPSD